MTEITNLKKDPTRNSQDAVVRNSVAMPSLTGEILHAAHLVFKLAFVNIEEQPTIFQTNENYMNVIRNLYTN
jgi:hypothetical protein